MEPVAIEHPSATAAPELIDALQLKVTTAHLKAKSPNFPVIYARKRQAARGAYAYAVIAANYADSIAT
jgi:hypothetical protein